MLRNYRFMIALLFFGTIPGFEVSGKNGNYRRATAHIPSAINMKILSQVEDRLRLRLDRIPLPNPLLTLYNSEQLSPGTFALI